ncbi:maleylpyruvate isomerase family mycothiol-dependent enzyme [Paractinoplanes lichenicola]|uniref:Maleylpyruvate isomerase family mycothiol-dependent enzyme n=1 Tax=Paractinoplanes lichenicola TaxID=2802976 RepID=A0ABS1VLA7_9ACTN|nr:maleylpyruvate isomerase family mycothiol-dependent enzyme [Actinoplanes lichenicola]MBL7255502.1 maleylpyruvate isomerase family mycothiol-dependent enzyme [Actinoplanes lichenicola]
MTTLAARTIAALRAEHDALASLADTLTPEQLKAPSGASEWTVADVYSHLGSGAEIGLANFRAELGEAEKPGPDFNQGVWDRWNALSPEDQVANWRESDEKLVAAFEALTPEQHETATLNPGFLPEAIPVASFVGMRLNEVANHTWDIRVGVDPAAGLLAGSDELLAEHLGGGLGFLLGWIAKPEVFSGPIVVGIVGTPYAVIVGDDTRLTTGTLEVTAGFNGPLEAALRLLSGRLGERYTPPAVTVSGNVTLDQLRAAFPGF